MNSIFKKILLSLFCIISLQSLCMDNQQPLNNLGLTHMLAVAGWQDALPILQADPFLQLLDALKGNDTPRFLTVLSQHSLSLQKLSELFERAVAYNRPVIAKLLLEKHTVTIDKWVIESAQESEDPVTIFGVLEQHSDFQKAFAQYQADQ